MGMKFAQIPEDTFKNLQLNAGILVKSFEPTTAQITNSDILAATSGGVNFTATPSYTDFGEDIDNCPNGMMELMQLETWEVTMSGNFIAINPDLAKMLVAVGDLSGNKITPRQTLAQSDFTDLWWIGDYSDNNSAENGGFVAIHMMNALNTGGFQLQSSKSAKGQFAFEFKGHYSIDAQEKVPFEVYIKMGGEE